VTVAAGEDGRRRVVALTRKGKAMLPQLAACWAATAHAAASLDADLAFPVSQCLADAIAALEARPFGARIRDARESPESRPRRKPAPKKGESQ
jgi:DNA-binding MarR family transcriptional regulator